MSPPLPLAPTDTETDKATAIDDQPTPLTIINVRLSHTDQDLSRKLWRVECRDGRVHRVTSQIEDEISIDNQVDAGGSLMLPSQKAAFPANLVDLYDRGARLIRESVECGVTSMRAHVEVDKLVGFSCLDVAQALRSRFQSICDVQIADADRRLDASLISVFAQEPLFDAPGDTKPGLNFNLLQEALQKDGISVIGSAPYVEPTIEQAKANIALIMTQAHEHDAHVDFHLDYNLDPNSSRSSMKSSLRREKTRNGGRVPGKTLPVVELLSVMPRACNSLPQKSGRTLAEAIKDLPITFIGLPQSDIYMQGRGDHEKPLGAPRSTLRVPYLYNKYGIEVAMSVNNVQNAFTPQGSLDPLALCSLGVAIFQTAAPADIETLVRSVTLTSKLAIGEGGALASRGLFPAQGDPADFVILHGADTLQSAVLHPPFDRTTIRAGNVVARRQAHTWLGDADETSNAGLNIGNPGKVQST
ncbi:hypothetical protein FPV67DRAFT_1738326 [Lyophyllum atratum]|nr:hypothetical protein FPV67DRAFT_1738326 [Lyophyllum atratum]